MFQNRERGSRMIIVSMAILFGILLLIFLYYLWAERFGGKDAITRPTPINYQDLQTVTKAGSGRVPNGLDPDSRPAIPNVANQPENSNEIPVDVDDPDYVPDGFVKNPGYQKKKQVFSIDSNVFTYHQAEAACKAHGADLATFSQLVKAYKKGADWCSKGWVKGQAALYPTQRKTWLKLQEDPDHKDDCGQVGINGGYETNPDKQFGVICYGYKREPQPHEKAKHEMKSQKDYQMEQEIAKIKKNMHSLSINPFNKDKWSNCNTN